MRVDAPRPLLTRTLAALGAMALATACREPSPVTDPAPPPQTSKERQPLIEEKDIALVASFRAGMTDKLVPEEAPSFDVAMKNTQDAARAPLSLDNNLATPLFRLLDGEGTTLGEYGTATMMHRAGAHASNVVWPPPVTVTLEPGAEAATWVNLWAYGPPAGPGRYAFEAIHLLAPGGPPVTSNRLAFEIVPAGVSAVALTYESATRMSSVLAWIAAGQAGSPPPRLLLRYSGFQKHDSLQHGGNPHGEVAPDARIALGHGGPDSPIAWLGWAAVAHRGVVEILQHNTAYSHFRAPPVPLPLSDVAPVPRFPDRGNKALFLATGLHQGAPVLAGVLADVMATPPAVPAWTVPLVAAPALSACAFRREGPVTLLFAHDDGASSHLRMLSVDEGGRVTSPEREVRTSDRRVLAITADLRRNAPPSFVVLEADRAEHRRMAVVTVPLEGEPQAGDLRDAGTFAAPAQVTLETTLQGVPIVALTDAAGALFAGTVSGGLSRIRFSTERRVSWPHIAALSSLQVAAFDERGVLTHQGD